MNILVYGAGVLGSLYAARLQEAGQHVSILARGQRLEDLRAHGIVLVDALTGRTTTTHQFTMPPEHGLWPEQEQALAEPSSGVHGSLDQFRRKPCERHFLPPRETSGAGASALQDPHLLTKQHDLEIFLTLWASEQSQEIQEDEKELYQHSHRLSSLHECE